MITSAFKLAVGGVATVALAGYMFLSSDMCSYVSTSVDGVRTAVKESVPIEFEIRRANNLLDDIIPEMQANVRLIAQEEVEVADLRDEITQARDNVDTERQRVKKIRNLLAGGSTEYRINSVNYSRDQVRNDLARRFERLQEAELVLTGKERLLQTRQQSLAGAIRVLEQTQHQKAVLENKIAALEAQHRAIQAADTGVAGINIDNTKIAQTNRLIEDIRKRLDVAERVLDRQATFTQPIDIDTVDESDLIDQVDHYFEGEPTETDDSGELALTDELTAVIR